MRIFLSLGCLRLRFAGTIHASADLDKKAGVHPAVSPLVTSILVRRSP